MVVGVGCGKDVAAPRERGYGRRAIHCDVIDLRAEAEVADVVAGAGLHGIHAIGGQGPGVGPRAKVVGGLETAAGVHIHLLHPGRDV